MPQEKKIYLLSLHVGGEADTRGLFLTGKRLVDISFYCLQEAHSLRLRESQSSYDTNAWKGGGVPRYSLKQRSHFL